MKDNEVSYPLALMLMLLTFSMGWFLGAMGERYIGHTYPMEVKIEPIHQPILPLPRPPMVMRDARIICLSAILAKTPRKNWDQITREMAHSGNVCTVAQFLYPKDIPEDVDGEARKLATQAVDHG